MPACRHASINPAHTGALSTCILCQAPIIWDGTRWQWTYGLDAHKLAKLRVTYEIDRITGKHVTSVP